MAVAHLGRVLVADAVQAPVAQVQCEDDDRHEEGVQQLVSERDAVAGLEMQSAANISPKTTISLTSLN